MVSFMSPHVVYSGARTTCKNAHFLFTSTFELFFSSCMMWITLSSLIFNIFQRQTETKLITNLKSPMFLKVSSQKTWMPSLFFQRLHYRHGSCYQGLHCQDCGCCERQNP